MTKCLNPDCFYQNPPGYKFCAKCGSKLLLGERYRATKYLGEGAFGRTFIAVDEQRLNTPCVIKQFLPMQGNVLAKAIELFNQEAKQLLELGKHPQIPDLMAFFEQESKLYLVQELIEGQDLAKELQQRGRFTENEVRRFLNELLPVLQFIHEKQVIHRDIKLENIIHRPNNSLVLIDFGVSKQLSNTVITQMGTITGTPAYAPPEQLKGIAYPCSDIYSLGVTAVRLLTGCVPMEKNGSLVDEIFDFTSLEWVWREWLQDKGLSVSDDLARILDKMLEDKSKNRYQSANEVIEALNSQSVVISQPPISQPQSPIQQPSISLSTIPQPIKGQGSPLKNQNFTVNLPNSINLDMIFITGGTFIMGSNEDDDEKPPHQVTVSPFCMGKYPITQAQWREVARLPKIREDLNLDPSNFKGDQRPVEMVNWYDAMEFCQRLSNYTEIQYRLPSEAEWEYACRAIPSPPTPLPKGEGSKYYFGDDVSKLGDYAWYNGNSNNQTHPVGEKKPNAFGLYDMHGNVWEWCLDNWHSNYKGAPTDGSSWCEKENHSHILRGGSWYYGTKSCRSANRNFNSPDNRSYYYGFRVVCVL